MMSLVVLLHAITSSGLMNYESVNDFIYVNIFRSFCLLAVNTFVLISGYYGIKFRLNGLIKLYMIAFFYALLGYLIHLIIDGQQLGFSVIYNSILCISHTKFHQWFLVSYFMLYIIAPFINVMISNISKYQFRYLLFGLTIINVYFGYFCHSVFVISTGFGLLQLIYVYIIGRYIRLYGNNYIGGEKKNRTWFLILSLSLFVWLIFSIIKYIYPQFMYTPSCYNNPFILVASVSFFYLFLGMHFYSKIVNYIASGTFAAYIVHTGNYSYGWFDNFFHKISLLYSDYSDNIIGILIILLCLSLIFVIIFSLLDTIRRYVMIPFWYCYSKIEPRLIIFYKSLFN